MLHIYYGNGKGKTTAAVGLTVRAVGSGMKVAFFQFLKNGSSSEISILEELENVTVICCEECQKFTFAMNDLEKNEVTLCHNEMLRKAAELMTGRNPSDKLKKRADYLTEMNAVKHPFDNGITARKGIEY